MWVEQWDMDMERGQHAVGIVHRVGGQNREASE